MNQQNQTPQYKKDLKQNQNSPIETTSSSNVRMVIFDNTNTSSLANLVEKIKLETLDDSKKSYIGISVI